MNEFSEDLEYLEHYGVLGMKWGIRRFQPYAKDAVNKGKFIGNKVKDAASDKIKNKIDSAKSERARSKEINDANKLVRQAQKDPSKLTNEELQKAMDRAKTMNTAQLNAESSQINTSKRASVKAAKNTDKLSDAELDYRINRMEREQRLKDATNSVNKKDHPIIKAAEKATTKVVANTVESGMKYAAGKAFESIGMGGVAKHVFDFKSEDKPKRDRSPKELNDLLTDVMKDPSRYKVDDIKEATDYVKAQQDFESVLKKNEDLYSKVKRPSNQKALPSGK